MILPRRSFLTGLGASLVAAPAIVRASSLMPVSSRMLSEVGLDDDMLYRSDVLHFNAAGADAQAALWAREVMIVCYGQSLFYAGASP